MKPLVLGLGNELLGDDGIGILAARELTREISEDADVVESSLHGMALIDVLAGYEKAIIIDAIQTGDCPPGTITEMTPGDFRVVYSPSPHYTGLPEMIQLARELKIKFPGEIRILTVEIANSLTLGDRLSPAVADSIPEVLRRAKSHLRRWETENHTGLAADSTSHEQTRPRQ